MPFRILVLCTGNSARSQMAEALLNAKGAGRIDAHSAGSHPASRVNPFAIGALKEIGIEWAGHEPRGLESVDQQSWDLVLTVCDRAKESCPLLPGQPEYLHWSIDDPADVEGTDADRHQAFRAARDELSTRIDALVLRIGE